MKFLSTCLLIISLTVGALAAASAYVVSLDLPDDQLVGLTPSRYAATKPPVGTAKALGKEPASPQARGGKEPTRLLANYRGQGDSEEPRSMARDPGGKGRPALAKPQKLTTEMIDELRIDDISYLRVKEFAWQRWPGRWYFLAAVVGLLASGILSRISTRREMTAAVTGQQADKPAQALQSVRQLLQGLHSELPALPTDDLRLKRILDDLGQVQTIHLPVIPESRPLLTAQLGLAGYAELMDRFAAAERQINRAWSAAADGVYPEAYTCIERAQVFLNETIARLPG